MDDFVEDFSAHGAFHFDRVVLAHFVAAVTPDTVGQIENCLSLYDLDCFDRADPCTLPASDAFFGVYGRGRFVSFADPLEFSVDGFFVPGFLLAAVVGGRMNVIFDRYDLFSFDLDFVDEPAPESGHGCSDAFGPHVHEGLGGDVQAVD